MKKLLVLTLFLSTFSIQNANAGILGSSISLEPSIGYKTENTKLTDLGLVVTDIKSSAPYASLRISYRSSSGIEIGLSTDYTTGKASVTNITEKNNFSKSSAGVHVGVNSMGYVKMFLGALFHNEFKLHESNFISETKFSGPAYNAGLVFQFTKLLSLGLQYNLNQYNKVQGANYTTGDSTDNYYSKIDTQDYSIYLSFDL